MEPIVVTSSSPPDPRSLVLPLPPTPLFVSTPLKTPSMPLRALDSLRDSHLGPMSPRLEVTQPPTPGPDAEDERREARADGDTPFPVDRVVLRQVIRERLGCEPTVIKFLSSGTFHKAFLVSLLEGPEVVARIARRYMPKLKTESEIATINYIRTHTKIPVPFIYAYDSDPYNKLGGEYIIMSKAQGVPLIRQFHSMSPPKVHELLHNLANMLIPLSTQTFPAIGSLYQTGELCPPRHVVRSMLRQAKMGIDPGGGGASVGLHLPQIRGHPIRPSPLHESATLPSPTSTVVSSLPSSPSTWTTPSTHVLPKTSDFYVGPIVAWPFFGSGRGELPSVNRPLIPLSPSTPTSSLPPSSHLRPESPNALLLDPSPSPTDQDPDEVDRGPFRTFASYTRACARREVAGVRREQEQAGAAHKPHLLPASEDGHHHHHHHAHRHGGHDLHVLHPPTVPKRRRKRAKSGLGALGYDGLGRKVKRRGVSGLGSLGNGDGPLPSLSVSSSSSASSSDLDSDSGSDSGSSGSCSCSDSGCSCSSGSSRSVSPDIGSDEDDYYRDYRSAQRSSLFVGLNLAREGAVKAEMDRWVEWMGGVGKRGGIEEEDEDEDSEQEASNGFAGIGNGGFVGVGASNATKPTPSKIITSTAPPRGVGVGNGGFVGVGPAASSTTTNLVSPPRPRGGVGPGGFVGVGPAPVASSPLSPTSPVPIRRGVGVGGGGFVGVGPGVAPSSTQSGTGFVGVGVGNGGFVGVGPIPSPPSPASPASDSGYGGFGGVGGFGVGVGGGGFLSVAAPISPPKTTALGRGVGVGGFVSVGPTQGEPKKETEEPKRKRVVHEEKDELGDFVLDLHDLSLANIFVDPVDSSKITCIIDWESTTIRPLWQAAHLPTFLVSATHAHSHPVTPRMQSSRISRGSLHPSHPESRASHPSHPDSRSSHRGLSTFGAHLPSSGAMSGMASIAALTAALNNYAQGVHESPRYGAFDSPKFESPRIGAFGESPRRTSFDLPRDRHYEPSSPRLNSDVLPDSPESAPRTAVLSMRQGLHHSYTYPSPLMHKKSGPNTAVNAIRPGGISRSASQRTDVHAHFGDDEEDRERRERRDGRDSGGETPRRVTREEAAEYFKRIAAEFKCPSDERKREGCGERWARAERERAAWRVAHRAVEWDGWELGLVESVLEDARTLQGDMDF